MNLLKLVFCLALAVGFISCDKDDKNCTQADWIGTYDGTVDCDGVEEDVVVTITASGSNDIIIQYETATVLIEYDPLTPDECNLDISESGGGITLTIDANVDGDKLTFRETYSIAGGTATCEINATK